MRFASTFAALAVLVASVSSATIKKRDAGEIIFATVPTELTTCTAYTFSWTGGEQPYTLGVYKSTGGLYYQGSVDATSYTWNVDAAGGKQVNVQIYDATGTYLGTTGNIDVTNGTDVSCVRCAGYMGYEFC